MRISALAVLFSGALAWGQFAQASVVFENSYTDGVNLGTSAWCSGCGANWRVWDTFDVASDSTITQIDARLWLQNTTQIEYSIWSADRSTQLFSQVIGIGDLATNDISSSGPEFDTSASITGLQLHAGTYALSIWDLADPNATTAWYQLPSTIDGSGFQSAHPDGTGSLGGGTGRDMAFRIHAGAISVPAPGSLALLGIGLVGFTFSRQRK